MQLLVYLIVTVPHALLEPRFSSRSSSSLQSAALPISSFMPRRPPGTVHLPTVYRMSNLYTDYRLRQRDVGKGREEAERENV